jgi:DNA-binding LytR/AlgR family response regulator
MKIKTIIIEDEPAAQKVLQKFIANTSLLELVAVFSNPVEANEFLDREKVDLMLLDINMPVISGLSFYKSLKNPPLVIFTTAYPEYALEGFEVDAIDYLVKPVSIERFLKAVNKASEYLKIHRQPSQPGHILLTAGKRAHKVPFQDITFVESMGDYVKVFINTKPLVVHQTLQDMERKLPADMFMRVHRSFIISLNHIKYIEGNMVKIDEVMIPVSDSYRRQFMDYMRYI